MDYHPQELEEFEEEQQGVKWEKEEWKVHYHQQQDFAVFSCAQDFPIFFLDTLLPSQHFYAFVKC